MNETKLRELVLGLTDLPGETEWVEFKHNRAEPDEIGQNLSALSNSAALQGKPCAHIVWGVDDSTHAVIGTNFKPRQAKVGNEELENWLLRWLDPRIDFRIHEGELDGKRVVVFQIPPAINRPVSFKHVEYIRVGSYTKKLREFSEKERALWRISDQRSFEQVSFEDGVSKANATSDEVLSLINYPKYFSMMKQPLPDNRAAILERLESEDIFYPEKATDMTSAILALFCSPVTWETSSGWLARRCG